MKRKRSSKGLVVRKPYGTPEYKKARYAMYTSPRLAWPQEYVTTLRWIYTATLNTAGVQVIGVNYSSNAYDIDAAVGGTAMPGFLEYSSFYEKFRTLQCTYNIDLMNREAFNVVGFTGFSNDSGFVVSVANCGNANWKLATMGPLTGNNKVTLRDSKSVVAIAGTKTGLYDDLYSGSTTSTGIPTTGRVYIYLGAQSPNAVFTAGGGIDFKITLDLKVQFFKTHSLTV